MIMFLCIAHGLWFKITAYSDMHSLVLKKNYIKCIKIHSEKLTEVDKLIQMQAES